MLRIALSFGVLLVPLLAQYPAPRAGWKLVPGGENLVEHGYWNSDDLTYGVIPTVNNGILTLNSGSGYAGNVEILAPHLVTTGNWGVVASFNVAAGLSGLATVFGSLNTTTANYWQGQTEIEFGVDNNGNYVFAYWDGTSSSPNVYDVLKTFPTPPTGTVTAELLDQNGQFTLYFNGASYGPYPDPGLFTKGVVMPGVELFAGQQMQMTAFAFEVPASDTTAKMQAPVEIYSNSYAGPNLASLAAAAGKVFGNSFTVAEFASGREGSTPGTTGGLPDFTVPTKAATQYYGVVSATMYYSETETVQNRFTLSDGDAEIAGARANGFQVHCHHLIGPNIFLPGWLTSGNFTSAQLQEILVNHVQTIVTHYQGLCSSWDVVNEPFASDGTIDTSSDNIWGNIIGPSYITLAFETARKADPAAKLYVNDYYIENQTPKATGMYNSLSTLLAQGAPIDGVGLECHWIPGNADPNWQPQLSSMTANMAQLAKMGLLTRLSEIDARLPEPASASDLANQATIFSTTVQACLNSPNCTGTWWWGADDAVSWIPAYYPGYGSATLFDANFNPKPGYTAVMNTLKAATAAKSAITSVSTASGGNVIAQNTYIMIKGFNLVPSTTPQAGTIWSSAPSFAQGQMPTQLGTISVTVNNKPAFVYYFCSAQSSPCTQDQINVLTPLDNTTGPVQVVVTNGSAATAPFTVTMVASDPTILLFNGLGPIVATHLNYTLAGSAALYPGYSTPAAPAETLAVYAVGFGLPTTAITNGSATQSGLLPSTPQCTVGGLNATVSAALISPGLYQLNLTIPSAAQSGDNAVSCTYNGATTPAGAFITVQQN